MSRDAAAASQPGMARVGKYLMLDLLGEGAFGKVRLAVDESSGKEYAIKVMEKSHIKANELTLQVRREIAVMKAMRHPNIVNLHEVLTSSKNLYMVMDLVTGGELFDAVAEHGRLSEARTRSYFQQLVDGIYYCHSRRVFHRDLKPENLLLSGDKQTLKITDFGLSSIKAHNAASELLHTVMGSPHYIAPEIITSAAQGYEGSKVDVWAAGVILFGMLAGFLPFDEPNTRALYKAIVHSPVQYPPHFSYDCVKLLRAMLQKDPNRRPSMEQVKGFTWFKVDYEPAIVPQPKPPVPSAAPAKKSRQRSRKYAHRSGKQKRKDSSPHVDDSNAGKRDTGAESSQQRENSICQSSDSKPISELFRRSSGHSSSSSSGKSMRKATMRQSSSMENGCDQENVDPHQTQSDEQNRKSERAEVNVEQDKLSNSFAQPPLQANSGPVESTARSIENTPLGSRQVDAQPLLPTNEHDTQPSVQVDKDSDVQFICRSGKRVPSEDSLVSKGPEALRVSLLPSTTDQPSGETGGSRIETFTNGESRDESAPRLESPFTPQVSRFSSAKLSSIGSGPEERRQESLRFGSDDLGINSLGMKQSLNDFVSPVSLNSQSSFNTPSSRNEHTGVLTPQYRSLMPTLFHSPEDSAEREIQREESDETRTTCDKPEEHRTVEALIATGEEAGIFKPMRSTFVRLAESASAKKATTSMSPSVFCPEFDTEADGSPQWCIDSMEVFADVEGEDDSLCLPKTVKGTTSQTMRELLMQAHDSARDFVGTSSDRRRSIFGPLDSDIAFKLSSSGDESNSTKAIRTLPIVGPEM